MENGPGPLSRTTRRPATSSSGIWTPPPVVGAKLSWQVLGRHLRLFEVAQRELGPARLREHHDPAINRVERLLARGREEAVFRMAGRATASADTPWE
jgi:hypothetical protein